MTPKGYLQLYFKVYISSYTVIRFFSFLTAYIRSQNYNLCEFEFHWFTKERELDVSSVILLFVQIQFT